MTETDTPEARRRRRQWPWIALLAGVVLCAVAAFIVYNWWRLNLQPLPATAAGTVFTLKRGENLAQLGHVLAERGVILHPWDLGVLARVRGEGARVKAGEYRIPSGTTAAGLLALMLRGEVLLHRFTIVPGERFDQVVAALEKNPVFVHRLHGRGDAAIMQRFGHPGEAPEGRFFPDTYKFPRGTPDTAVLRRAYAAMQNHLKALWPGRAQGLPLITPYQAVILASIIEKETAVPRERGEIAGVFVRRLERNMRLDADPTVIYGLGADYQGKLTRPELARDTPYNTYLHPGLPPTAICMPGLASLKAALHPTPGTALYFVAKGDGTHVFSATLAEQEQMIRKYQLHEGDDRQEHGKKRPLHNP